MKAACVLNFNPATYRKSLLSAILFTITLYRKHRVNIRMLL